MVRRVRIWLVTLAVLGFAGAEARGQWASPYSDEPFAVGYDALTRLGELLQLDAPTHELLVALHLDMLNAENERREAVRAYIEKRRHADDVDWREGFQLNMDLTHDLEAIGERFFEDVKLIIDPERAVFVDHMQRRVRMGRWFEVIDDEVSGCSVFPFELLDDKQIVSEDRFRELVVLHADEERRLWEQFRRTYEAILKIQQIGRELSFELDDADPKLFGEVGKAFKDALDQVHRLRDANEGLAESIGNALDEDQRTRFEAAWWEANYRDVQEPTAPELAARMVLDGEDAGGDLKRKVEEIRAVFDERLRIARRMARIAKHRTDLDFDLSMILEGTQRNTALYDDAMERLAGIAESYASALRGVMTQEERVRYRLETPEDGRQP